MLALHCLRAGREEVLLEHYAQLFPDALELLEVLGVLTLVLDLGVDACVAMLVDFLAKAFVAPGARNSDCERTLEYPDGSREVVDAAGGSEGSDDNAGGGNEIVGEGVVEVTLQLEDVLHTLELLLVSVARKAQG